MRSLRTRGHSTPTHQAAETSPTDFTRMLLKRLLLMKNEGLPNRLAINRALHTRYQGRILRKNSIFFPTFSTFFDITEVFQPILLL